MVVESEHPKMNAAPLLSSKVLRVRTYYDPKCKAHFKVGFILVARFGFTSGNKKHSITSIDLISGRTLVELARLILY